MDGAGIKTFDCVIGGTTVKHSMVETEAGVLVNLAGGIALKMIFIF